MYKSLKGQLELKVARVKGCDAATHNRLTTRRTGQFMDISANIVSSPDRGALKRAVKSMKKHEKYNTAAYKKRIKERDINARRILLLLEHRCMGKVGLRQAVISIFRELELTGENLEELRNINEAALDYLKGLGFIDLAEEAKYHTPKDGEPLRLKTYGITLDDDIVLTFRGVKECEIMHKPWFFRYTDRTLQHMDSFSNHTGLWMVLAAISILGYFVSL